MRWDLPPLIATSIRLTPWWPTVLHRISGVVGTGTTPLWIRAFKREEATFTAEVILRETGLILSVRGRLDGEPSTADPPAAFSPGDLSALVIVFRKLLEWQSGGEAR